MDTDSDTRDVHKEQHFKKTPTLTVKYYQLLENFFDLTTLPHIHLLFFFLNDPAPPEIYTLPLHDALPISVVRLNGLRPDLRLAPHRLGPYPVRPRLLRHDPPQAVEDRGPGAHQRAPHQARHAVSLSPSGDRKSTRLNSSHGYISYAVFCLK